MGFDRLQFLRTLPAVAAFLLCSGSVRADDPAPAASPQPAPVDPAGASSAARPKIEIRRIDGEVTIDGRLDEPQWQQAAKVTGYYPLEPVETGTAPAETEVYIFYDADQLYFGFHCYAKNPDAVRAHVSPRESVQGDDQVGIYLDTYDDQRNAFVFYTTALGTQWDARYTEKDVWNQSWDTVYRSRGQLTSDGYIVEIAIPFRSLRFPNRPEQKWGLILTREFAAEGVKFIWPKVTREKSNYIGQAADLEGIKGIASNRNLELQPTIVTQWSQDPAEAADLLSSPLRFNATEHLSIAPGLTVKYGVTSNLTLDAAINPDFSQVESDAGQLSANLRFALYYQEKRPFFLEGTEAFGAPYLSLHSRSIVLPFAGLKLTGRQGPYTIGLLSAYDMQPQASITYPTVSNTVEIPATGDTIPDFSPGLSPFELEGRAAEVSVARVARDIGNGNAVGVMLADKEVVDPENGSFHGFHRYVAADASLHLGQTNQLTAYLGSSWTGRRTSEDVTLDEGETESADDDVKVTLPESTIHGWAYLLQLSHSTRKFRLQVTNAYEAPNFRAETSYIPLVGFAYSDLYTQYIFEPKIKGVVFIRPQLYSSVFFDPNAEDTLAEYKLQPTVVSRVAGQNWFWLGYSQIMERPDEQSRRARYGVVGYESSMLEQLYLNLEYREGERIYYAKDTLGYSYMPRVSLIIRPARWFQVDLGFNREIFLEQPQPFVSYFPQWLSGKAMQTPAYDQSVVNTTVNLNFSQALSLRLTGRYRHVALEQDGVESGGMSGGALLTWLPYPGTAAYLGMSRGAAWDQDGFLEDGQDWRVFLKLSYLWRA